MQLARSGNCWFRSGSSLPKIEFQTCASLMITSSANLTMPERAEVKLVHRESRALEADYNPGSGTEFGDRHPTIHLHGAAPRQLSRQNAFWTRDVLDKK